MDAYEATKVVFSRIQTLDPENAAKIMGMLLLKDHGEKEMIRLAFGPETLLHSVILNARKDLGLSSSSSPASPSTGMAVSPFLNRQNSSSGRVMPPSPLAVSSPSWAPSNLFSRSNGAVEELQNSEELVSPNNGEPSPFFNGGSDYLDELQLQEQLAFLNDQSIGPKTVGNAGTGDLIYSDMECRSPSGPDSLGFPYGWHRRSCSASTTADLAGLGGDAAAGFGWKPCMYFARGYCKNGSTCRFVHGLLDENAAAALVGSKMDAAIEQQCHELLLRSKSQRIGSASQLMASAFPYSPTGSPSASSKCLSFLLQQQQQQNESRRAAAAAAAAALMLGGDESHKFMARARLDRNDLNPVSRQIYLTFPADSTFREEDVSNYFSIYGPVQDVRIPYQQKRMFGFVTFVYPETVKLILAKGNPHFVCDARVLVKPYKEKGKVPDKFRKQQVDFSLCTSPTGLGLDSRGDPFDLQQLGSRMLYNSGSSQELLLRRKLEEQQQAAELQKAIELQSRRFMGLQLMDLKNRNILSSSAPAFINTTSFTPTPPILADEKSNGSSSINSNEMSSPEEKSPTGGAGEGVQMTSSYHGFFYQNAGNNEDSNVEAIAKNDSEFQESDEHNLPDSPFASPTKSSNVSPFSAAEGDIATSSVSASATATLTPTTYNNASNSSSNTSNNHLISPTLLPPSSTLDMGPFTSCFFQMPRLSSSHGAIGM